ncbi:MAG: diaminopimelate epimerase [Lachnospiraceae bacterium]|nr:diaminopimelate epimerase [Lachnospiraceae bacterium]
MKFTKMEGIGNDYVYVNCFQEKVEDPRRAAVKVSDRHYGIGSDGLILIKPSDVADFCMDMYNADGSQSEMCGNGIRCVAKYVYDYGLTDKTSISVETLAGIKYLDLKVEDGKVAMVTVNMGQPELIPAKIPVKSDKDILVNEPVTVGGREYKMTCVSMGNPHCIVFVEDTEGFPLEEIGPQFENHAIFPNRVNAEFIQILDRKTVNMRVWERGSGETLACGTGACASAVACILNDLTDEEITIHLLGGDLLVRWDKEKNVVYMTGPATVVFDGEIADEKLA